MKGKHGVAAAARKEQQAAAHELETWQRRATRAEAESADLKERLEAATKQHVADVRVLKERMSAGAAPEVEVLQEQLRRLMEQKAEVEALAKEYKDTMEKLHYGLQEWLFDMKMVRNDQEAFALNLAILRRYDSDFSFLPEGVRILQRGGNRKATDAEAAVAAAKGTRSSTEIEDDLRKRLAR